MATLAGSNTFNMKTILVVTLASLLAISSSAQTQGTALRSTNGVAFGTLTVQGHVNGTNTSVTNALLGKFVTGAGNVPAGAFGIVGGVNNQSGQNGITVGAGNLVSAANALSGGRSNSIGSDAINSISAGFLNTGSGQNSYVNGESNNGGGQDGFIHGSRILVNSGIAGVDHNFLTGQRYSLQDGTSNTFVWSVGSPVLALDGSDSGAFYINASNKIALLGAPIYGNGLGLTNIPGASITTPFVGVSGASPYTVSNLWSVALPDGATAFQLGNPGAGYASIFATNLIITPDGLHYTLFTDGTNSFFGGDLYLTNSTFHGKSFRPTKVAMTIVGATAQSTNLMELQDGSSNVLASVTASGVFTGNGAGLTNVYDLNNVKYWGAIGNAVADNSVPLSNAIYYASQQVDARVFVPHGFYNYTNTLVLPAGVMIVGENKGTDGGCAALRFYGSGPAITLSNHCSLRDLSVVGAYTNLIGLNILGADRVSVRDCQIFGFKDGVLLNTSTIDDFSHNYVKLNANGYHLTNQTLAAISILGGEIGDNTNAAVLIEGTAGDILLGDGLTIQGNAAAVVAGATGNKVRGLSIKNCYFENLAGKNDLQLSNVLSGEVSGNTFAAASDTNIVLVSSQNITVMNNIHHAGQSILVDSTCTNISVINNDTSISGNAVRVLGQNCTVIAGLVNTLPSPINVNGGGNFTVNTNWLIAASGGAGVGTTNPQTAFDVNGVLLSRTAASSAPTVPLEGLRFALTGQADSFSSGNYRNSILNSVGSSAANADMVFNICNGVASQATVLSLFGNTDAVAEGRLISKTAANSAPNTPLEGLVMSLAGFAAYDTYKNSIWNSISSSGASALMLFRVANGSGSQNSVMMLRGDGLVGIGTTNPAAKLDVNGGAFVQSLTITNSTYPTDNAITNGQAMGSLWFGGTSSNAHTAFIDYYKVVRSVVAAHGVVLTDVTVTNSATATTNTVIYTVPMAANYLTVGKVLEPQLDGVIWQNSNVGTFPTLQAWINQTNLLLTIPLLNSTSITAGPWQANFRFTVRAIGNSAQLMGKCLEVQSSTSGGVSTSGLDSIVTPVTFDSTVNNTITITVSNSVAGGGGNCSVRLQEGRTVCIDSVPKLPGE